MLPAADATWTVHTDVFDGPLDLLLYLVKRDGVDLRRVRMSSVCDSYLAFLDRMRELDISIASEYLVMAATLCHLKSLELLPRPPRLVEDEEVEDPAEVLARRLEEYEQIRHAGEQLNARPRLGRDVFRREPEEIDERDRPLLPGVDAFGLLDIYYELLTRASAAPPTHTIHRPEVDLQACCRHVLDTLGTLGATQELGEILSGLATRPERVVAFLSVLEMVRLGFLRIEQTHHLAPAKVTAAVDPAEAPLDDLMGFEEATAS